MYRDEAQLDNKKKKAAKAKRKAELLEAKLAKKHLHAINKKSKKIKKSHKKRKVNSAAIVKATKTKIASKRASPNKKVKVHSFIEIYYIQSILFFHKLKLSDMLIIIKLLLD